MKKYLSIILLLVALCLLSAACGQQTDGGNEPAPIADGVYSAEFNTDSSMFHVNEAHNGKGVLTVEDGKMTMHISLPSKNIVNLFCGTAEEAQAAGAELLAPTTDTVSYDDGTSEEVYGFDIPVPYLDEEFDCALVGTKGKWYDHKVSVSNPVPTIADGEYSCAVTLAGGTGRASVESPAKISISGGKAIATVVWSSPYYEYMTIGDTQYDPVQSEGNSTFEIPVSFDEDIAVSALTTAMSQPHLIEYTLHFDGETLEKAN